MGLKGTLREFAFSNLVTPGKSKSVFPHPSYTVCNCFVQEDEAEDGDAAKEAANRKDPETFDDSEFYQQLLKELLEGSGADAATVQTSAQVLHCVIMHASGRVSQHPGFRNEMPFSQTAELSGGHQCGVWLHQ
jgi:hypothetical protein